MRPSLTEEIRVRGLALQDEMRDSDEDVTFYADAPEEIRDKLDQFRDELEYDAGTSVASQLRSDGYGW